MKTRAHQILFISAILTACTAPEPRSGEVTTADSTSTPNVEAAIEANWPGYYTDTLPCADCPGIETSLWVRADSTFILQQRYLEKDTLPVGTIGQWHVVQGLLTIGYTGDKPDFYRYTKDGLLMVDEMGVADDSKLDWTLDKLADDIGDAIPRMRLTGTYTYKTNTSDFRPCGSRFTWPCAGGMDTGEEEGEPLVKFTNADLQKAYRKAVKNGGDPWTIDVVCTMGMGPAMEGNGADEYVYVIRVVKTIGQCP